jgi:hypothetical protein
MKITGDFIIERCADRVICIKGVGKMFYQGGFPLAVSINKFKEYGIEVSLLHVVEELWDNGWSWKTIESKLTGELSDDIDKTLDINFETLEKFYSCLEQPYRGNGGYEQSREMIFEYLFGTSKNDVRSGSNTKPLNWMKEHLQLPIL